MIDIGKNRPLSATAFATLTALAALASAPVSAAEVDQANAANDGPAIEEIIVTSQRRRQRLQDVPLSVTALGEDFLIENDVRTLQDLSATVPGFVTTNSVSYSAAPLSIRGIGGANGGGNFFADEPVAVYSDGVYIGRLSFSTADLLDIASIEVLRGP